MNQRGLIWICFGLIWISFDWSKSAWTDLIHFGLIWTSLGLIWTSYEMILISLDWLKSAWTDLNQRRLIGFDFGQILKSFKTRLYLFELFRTCFNWFWMFSNMFQTNSEFPISIEIIWNLFCIQNKISIVSGKILNMFVLILMILNKFEPLQTSFRQVQNP